MSLTSINHDNNSNNIDNDKDTKNSNSESANKKTNTMSDNNIRIDIDDINEDTGNNNEKNIILSPPVYDNGSHGTLHYHRSQSNHGNLTLSPNESHQDDSNNNSALKSPNNVETTTVLTGKGTSSFTKTINSQLPDSKISSKLSSPDNKGSNDTKSTNNDQNKDVGSKNELTLYERFVELCKCNTATVVLIVCSILCIALVVTTIVLVFISVQHDNDNLGWVTHTTDVQTTVYQLALAIYAAEVNVRGHIISPDDTSIINQFNSNQQYINGNFTKFVSLTSDNPIQSVTHANAISAMLATQLAAWQNVITTCTTTSCNQTASFNSIQFGFTALQSYILVNPGTCDGTAAQCSVIGEELYLYAQRSTKASNQFQVSLETAAALLAVVVLLVIVMTTLILFRQKRAFETQRVELTQQVEEAKQEAKQKSSFLATMSHELRTPMNGVLAMSELLSYTNLDSHQADLLSTVRSSASSMMLLVNDLLMYLKLEAGMFRLTPISFNLQSFLKDVDKLFRLRAITKGLEFSVTCDDDVPPYLVADADRLRQILINLLDNALKFTEKGSVNLHVQVVAIGSAVDISGTSDHSTTHRHSENNSGFHQSPAVQSRHLATHVQNANNNSIANNVGIKRANNNNVNESYLPALAKNDVNNGVSPAASPYGSLDTLQAQATSTSTTVSPATTARSTKPMTAAPPTKRELVKSSKEMLHQTVNTFDSDVVDQIAVIQFTVSDTGCGVSPEGQRKIWQPFQQADSSIAGKYGGTGLGLSIASDLVQLLGGRMSVTSQVGVGTTFNFTIRCAVSQNQATNINAENNTINNNGNGNGSSGALVNLASTNGSGNLNELAMEDTWKAMDMRMTNISEIGENDRASSTSRMSNTNTNTMNISTNESPQTPTLYPEVLPNAAANANSLYSVNLAVADELHRSSQTRDNHSINDTSKEAKSNLRNKSLSSSSSSLSESSSSSSLSALRNRKSNRQLRILLCEDNPINIKVALNMIKRFNHEVTIAQDGEQGIAKWKEAYLSNTPFDVVLMDVLMPKVDGLDATREIRRLESLYQLQSSLYDNASTGNRESISASINGMNSNASIVQLPRSQTEKHDHILHQQITPSNEIQKSSNSNSNNDNSADNNSDRNSLVAASADPLPISPTTHPSVNASTNTSTSRSISSPSSTMLPTRTPIICMSASVMDDDQLKAKQSGMDAFVAKPLSLQAISNTLNRIAEMST